MRSAFNKDIVRSITKTLGRYIAIAAIVALGTGFYAGLRMTAPDMKLAADQYYDGTALMDIRVVSTLGLTDNDMRALDGVDGVAAVMPAYETDVVATIDGDQYTVRVHSLPPAALESETSDGVHAYSSDEHYLNRPILAEGSWPTQEGECVLSSDKVTGASVGIGDTVVISEGVQNIDEVLVARTYTIVGFVHSSYYASSTSMGSTSVGSGSIQQYMFVPQDNFLADVPYTEAFVAVKNAALEASSSDEYHHLVEAARENIDAIAPQRQRARADELREQAQKELDAKRSDFESEKSEVQTQLQDSKRMLDEAAAGITEAEQKLSDAQTNYNAGEAEFEQQQSASVNQLSAAQQQVQAYQEQVDAARPAIDQGQKDLSRAWAQWQEGSDALAQARITWQAQADPLFAARDQMQQAVDALREQISLLDPQDPHYVEKKAALEQQIDDLLQQKTQFEAANQEAFVALEAARQQLDGEQQQLDAAKQQLDTSQSDFDSKKAEFDAAVLRVEQGSSDLASARSLAEGELSSARQLLDSAAAEIARGRVEWEQGRQDFEHGLAEYEEKKTEADTQLLDAETQLQDAQNQINDIENPTWLVMSREQNYGVTSFESDANRVDSIAQVFPFIFFLVAALVALTTMTRMVEEERVLIGTFKALGYSHARIAAKYLLYAASASMVGSILGIAVLSQILPFVISNAYAIIYYVPLGPLPIDMGLAGLALGLGVGVTLIATAAAVFTTLAERPAFLMLPRAPKAGKRILLERFGPLWRRMSFSWKVTFRNLFRYKKRFIMTVIGIAGCTALLLTGLGLQDAINDIVDKQFSEIMRYNTVVVTEEEVSDVSEEQIVERLSDERVVSAFTRVQADSMVAKGPQSEETRVLIDVPQTPQNFGNFFTLRTRVGHHPIEVGREGVVLAEKLALTLGVGVGDTIHLAEQDSRGNATETVYDLVVSDVMENYIYNYVFLGPDLYQRLKGEAPAYSTYFAVLADDESVRTHFTESMQAIDGVKTTSFNDETIDSYKTMLRSVGLIVVVLVVAAASLAFIVLYNLTNINITERVREIATLKVLGFTPREMSAYIFRETLLLSIIGCMVGLVFGVYLEGFVVVTAEVDQVMFGRTIHALSYLIAFVLTMVFTVLVMLSMRRKLARIDMVESLKSNE